MPREVSFHIDGTEARADEGVCLAAALAACGKFVLRRSLDGAPRAAFCGMGVCFECRVRVDGVERLACLTPLSAGMTVSPDV